MPKYLHIFLRVLLYSLDLLCEKVYSSVVQVSAVADGPAQRAASVRIVVHTKRERCDNNENIRTDAKPSEKNIHTYNLANMHGLPMVMY